MPARPAYIEVKNLTVKIGPYGAFHLACGSFVLPAAVVVPAVAVAGGFFVLRLLL